MRGLIINNVSLTVVLLCCVTSVYLTEYVPVYLWGQSRSSEPVPALSRISKDSFKDVLLERTEIKPLIVVFAEKNLSPEDFSLSDASGNTVLPKLSLIKSYNTYWPSVQDPLNIIRRLPKVRVNEMSIQGEQDMQKMLKSFKTSEDQILLIELNDAKDDEDRIEMLKRHDELIDNVYNTLIASHDEVVALYTAKHSSWVVPEAIRKRQRQTRQLLAAKEEATNSPTVYNTTHVLMYVSDTPVFGNETVNEMLTNYKAESVLNGDNMTVTLSNDSSKVSIKLDLLLSNSGYWFLDAISATYMGSTEDFKVKNIYAPAGFSYHCSGQIFFGDKGKMNLTFPGLQIQPNFGNESAPLSFGDAYDCVGFTSTPIWSGLFVTFILVLILTLGISMMMDIKTMDRFDDPKGKTITIIASE